MSWRDYTLWIYDLRIAIGVWNEWKISLVEDEFALYEVMQEGELFLKGSERLDSIFYVREIPCY